MLKVLNMMGIIGDVGRVGEFAMEALEAVQYNTHPIDQVGFTMNCKIVYLRLRELLHPFPKGASTRDSKSPLLSNVHFRVHLVFMNDVL